jgi:hypothetical protein
MLKTLQKKQDYGVRWVTFTLSALTGQDYANTIVFPQLKPCQGNSNFVNARRMTRTHYKKAIRIAPISLSRVGSRGATSPLTTAKREQNRAADATASSSSTPALRLPTSRSARCSSCSRSFSPRHAAHPLALPADFLPAPPLPATAAVREP